MKIRVSFCRKLGLPNFSSVGGECSLEWEANDLDTPLETQLRAFQDFAERSVAAQLERAAGQGGGAEPPAPAEPPPGDDDVEFNPPEPPPSPRKIPLRTPPPPKADRPDYRRAPAPARPQQAGGDNGLPNPPKSGKAVYPWAKKLEERGYGEVLKFATRWGKERGLSWKTAEWPDEAAEALADDWLRLFAATQRH